MITVAFFFPFFFCPFVVLVNLLWLLGASWADDDGVQQQCAAQTVAGLFYYLPDTLALTQTLDQTQRSAHVGHVHG